MRCSPWRPTRYCSSAPHDTLRKKPLRVLQELYEICFLWGMNLGMCGCPWSGEYWLKVNEVYFKHDRIKHCLRDGQSIDELPKQIQRAVSLQNIVESWYESWNILRMSSCCQTEFGVRWLKLPRLSFIGFVDPTSKEDGSYSSVGFIQPWCKRNLRWYRPYPWFRTRPSAFVQL